MATHFAKAKTDPRLLEKSFAGPLPCSSLPVVWRQRLIGQGALGDKVQKFSYSSKKVTSLLCVQRTLAIIKMEEWNMTNSKKTSQLNNCPQKKCDLSVDTPLICKFDTVPHVHTSLNTKSPVQHFMVETIDTLYRQVTVCIENFIISTQVYDQSCLGWF